MNLSENVILFVVAGIIGLLQYLFSQMVINRIEKLDKKIEFTETKNESAHKELWIELHRVDKDTSNRIQAIETRCDIEGQIRKLLSTT